jgi:hypothetical protein
VAPAGFDHLGVVDPGELGAWVCRRCRPLGSGWWVAARSRPCSSAGPCGRTRRSRRPSGSARCRRGTPGRCGTGRRRGCRRPARGRRPRPARVGSGPARRGRRTGRPVRGPGRGRPARPGSRAAAGPRWPPRRPGRGRPPRGGCRRGRPPRPAAVSHCSARSAPRWLLDAAATSRVSRVLPSRSSAPGSA